MNKSTKIISSLAALGALCVGTAAMASPWHNGNCPGAGVPEAQCPIAGYDSIFQNKMNLQKYLWATAAFFPDEGAIWGIQMLIALV